MSNTAKVIKSAEIWLFIVFWQRAAMLRRLAKTPTKATVQRPMPSVAKLYFRKMLYQRSEQVIFVARNISCKASSSWQDWLLTSEGAYILVDELNLKKVDECL